MKRGREQWESIEQEDIEFWKKVERLLVLLSPDVGIRFEWRMVTGVIPQQSRVVMVPVHKRVDALHHACGYFTSSPDWAVLIPPYVIDTTTGNAPVALRERELLLKLCNIFGNPYTTSVCRAADRWFHQGDDVVWAKEEVVEIRGRRVMGSEVRQALKEVFPVWIQYIKRHGIQDKIKRPLQERLTMLCECLDGLRNSEVRFQTWPMRFVLENDFKLVDHTLCWPLSINAQRCAGQES